MTKENSSGNKDHWEREAGSWLAWARTEGFDSYWYYSPAFFNDIVPSPAGCTLEVGCGEGRVARDLVRRGHRVFALDASPTLIRKAVQADSAAAYLNGDAAALPFPDEIFNLVVAYNCLMDFDNMSGALAEVSRVLRPEGRLAVCVVHPLNDAGKFAGKEPGAPFVISGPYLGERREFNEIFRREDREMHFRGWSYSLEGYAGRLEKAGFAIERLREPAATEESIARFGESDLRWRRIPVFLMLRAVKMRETRRIGGAADS